MPGGRGTYASTTFDPSLATGGWALPSNVGGSFGGLYGAGGGGGYFDPPAGRVFNPLGPGGRGFVGIIHPVP